MKSPKSRRGRRLGICLSMLSLAAVPSAFAQAAASAPARALADMPTFAVVYPLVHPFFEPVTEQAIGYGRERGVHILTYAPEGKNVGQQIDIMKELIAMKVDGIALCATDPTLLAPYVDAAIAAGIPTIAFESDIPDSHRLGFIGTNNYEAGRHLADVLAREIGYRGEAIICTGLSTQMSLNERIKGIRDALREKYPDVRIVDLRSGEGDPELTLSVIESQVAEHPGFASFTSIDANGGPIAVSIWKAKGWGGGIHKIVTFDDMPENIAGIRAGIVSAIVSQKQWTWGRLIVDRLLALSEGRTVVDYLDTGTVEITRDNVDSYRR